MPTSSITKDFYVADPEAFQRLREDLNQTPYLSMFRVEPSSLWRGREALARFQFAPTPVVKSETAFFESVPGCPDFEPQSQ